MSDITNLTYKQVLDEGGKFKELEIHQGDQVITISLGLTVYGDGSGNTKWQTIKKTIDDIQQRVTQEVQL